MMSQKISIPALNSLLTAIVKRSRLIVLIFLVTLVFSLIVANLGSRQGFEGKYFNNDSWGEPAVASEIDKTIHFQKSRMAKTAGYSEKYSAIWEGVLFVARDAEFLFSVNSDDGSWVTLDDNLLIDNGDRHEPIRKDKTIFLRRGRHRIQVKYFDSGGDGIIDFSVKKSGALSRILPPLPVYPGPITDSRYRMDRLLGYANILLKCLLGLSGIAVLGIAWRKVLNQRDPFTLLVFCLFGLLVVFYGKEILAKKSTAVGGCDSYAYLQGAVNMARQGLFRTELSDPLIPRIRQSYSVKLNDDQIQFFLSPHGHYVHDLEKGLIYNVFPPGMSLLLFPFVKIAGVSAAFYVLPFLTLLFLILFFYFGTKYVNIHFGICLAAFVFFNREVFFSTVVIMSDVPSMISLAGSFFLLYVSFRTSKRYLIVFSAALFGFAVMLRYPNVLGGFPLLYLFFLKYRMHRKPKDIIKDALWFGASFILFGFLPNALYSHHLYGSYFRLVYEPITGSKTGLVHFLGGVVFYGKTLLKTCGWPGLAVILFGLGAALIDRKKRPLGMFSLTLYFSFFVFYAFQSIRHERYLIPALPVLGVLYAFGALALTQKFTRIKLLKFLLIVLLAVYPLFRSIRVYDMGNFSEEKISLQLKKSVEANAVVFCDFHSGPLRLYAGLTSYRNNWTPDFILRDTVLILASFRLPVYFFLDSKPSEEYFQDLIKRGYLDPQKIRLISRISGIPLYKYGDN